MLKILFLFVIVVWFSIELYLYFQKRNRDIKIVKEFKKYENSPVAISDRLLTDEQKESIRESINKEIKNNEFLYSQVPNGVGKDMKFENTLDNDIIATYHANLSDGTVVNLHDDGKISVNFSPNVYLADLGKTEKIEVGAKTPVYINGERFI